MQIHYCRKGHLTIIEVIELSAFHALHCEVEANLRMIGIDWSKEKKEIDVFFYFDKSITDSNKESASCIIEEIWADFENQFQISEHCHQLDYPNSLPKHTITVFLRKEKSL